MRPSHHKSIILAFSIVSLIAATAKAAQPLQIIGQWLTNAPGTSNIYITNWQTSDLAYDRHSQTLWSIGDQNSKGSNSTNRTGFLYQLEPSNTNVISKTVPIEWADKNLENEVKKRLTKAALDIDYEGLAADPTRTNHFYACTEELFTWLLEIVVEPNPTNPVARVIKTFTIPDIHPGDTEEALNRRWEGITVSPDGGTIYLLTEAAFSPTRLYKLETNQLGKLKQTGDTPLTIGLTTVTVKNFDLSSIGNLTGTCFITNNGSLCLALLERNGLGVRSNAPPTVYFFNYPTFDYAGKIAFDLAAQSTSGQTIQLKSASPEGIATDGTSLFLISDPASRFYKIVGGPMDDKLTNEKLSTLVPLFFQTPLTNALQRVEK